LRTWRQTKVWHAWPIAFADLAWIVLAIGLEDGGPRGLSIAFAALAVLSLFAGTLCFFGRDGGASGTSATNRPARGATEPPNKELKLTKPEHIGASQLNSSVGRTFWRRGAMTPIA